MAQLGVQKLPLVKIPATKTVPPSPPPPPQPVSQPSVVKTPQVLVQVQAQPPQIQRPKVQKVKKLPKPKPKPPKEKSKYSQYRYRTRILKGCILPILYGVISIQMLNKYTYEFPNYFEYNTLIIVFGFLLGFLSLTGITLSNMIRAKNQPKSGIDLKLTIGFVVYIPFLIILLALAFFFSLSTAWQFSMGFFLAAIFPLFIVIFYEIFSRRKFFVQEVPDAPSEGRKLIATY